MLFIFSFGIIKKKLENFLNFKVIYWNLHTHTALCDMFLLCSSDRITQLFYRAGASPPGGPATCLAATSLRSSTRPTTLRWSAGPTSWLWRSELEFWSHPKVMFLLLPGPFNWIQTGIAYGFSTKDYFGLLVNWHAVLTLVDRFLSISPV